MLSRRLTRKLEGLSDEAQAHLEAQADQLLAMGHGRRRELRALHLLAGGKAHVLDLIPRPPAAKAHDTLSRVDARAADLAMCRDGHLPRCVAWLEAQPIPAAEKEGA